MLHKLRETKEQTVADWICEELRQNDFLLIVKTDRKKARPTEMLWEDSRERSAKGGRNRRKFSNIS